MKDEVALLYTTWPDAESAAAAARLLVEERLCACVNILAPALSVYAWQGALEQTSETPALFKTTAEAAERLRDRIAALHPYETPCILMVPTSRSGSLSAYCDWIVDGILKSTD